MKKKLRFLLPHEPLKVLRGEPDEEDEQDELFRRFQPPPGTTTEEEQDDDNTDNDNDEDDFTTDADYVSDDGMGRDFDEHNANATWLMLNPESILRKTMTSFIVKMTCC